MKKTKSGIELIADERREQIEKHGITPKVDLQLNSEVDYMYPLPMGAVALLDRGFNRIPAHWNKLRVKHMMEKTYKEKLIIAAALLAAEIDRLQLEEEEEPQDPHSI